MSKKTLVLGASNNPERYAYKAIMRLKENHHPIVAVSNKKGGLADIEFVNDINVNETIDTVTLYLSAENQKPYYDKLIQLKPKRIIFNPGTENEELEELARKNNIEPVIACTLVMLSVGNY